MLTNSAYWFYKRYRTWHQISENLLHILVTFLTRFCWVYQNLLGNLLGSYWIWHKKEDQSGDIPYITRNSGTKKKINLVTSDIPSPPPSNTNTHIYGRRVTPPYLLSFTEVCKITKKCKGRKTCLCLRQLLQFSQTRIKKVSVAKPKVAFCYWSASLYES